VSAEERVELPPAGTVDGAHEVALLDLALEQRRRHEARLPGRCGLGLRERKTANDDQDHRGRDRERDREDERKSKDEPGRAFDREELDPVRRATAEQHYGFPLLRPDPFPFPLL
jgi:hypothetical protein